MKEKSCDEAIFAVGHFGERFDKQHPLLLTKFSSTCSSSLKVILKESFVLIVNNLPIKVLDGYVFNGFNRVLVSKGAYLLGANTHSVQSYIC